MDLDDLVPKKKKSYELGQDLSKLSVGELAELIESLKEEIARVEATRVAKNPRAAPPMRPSSVNQSC